MKITIEELLELFEEEKELLSAIAELWMKQHLINQMVEKGLIEIMEVDDDVC